MMAYITLCTKQPHNEAPYHHPPCVCVCNIKQPTRSHIKLNCNKYFFSFFSGLNMFFDVC